jgi:hypothetical protein
MSCCIVSCSVEVLLSVECQQLLLVSNVGDFACDGDQHSFNIVTYACDFRIMKLSVKFMIRMVLLFDNSI